MVVVLYKSSVSAAKKIMALREINYDKDKHMLVKRD